MPGWTRLRSARSALAPIVCALALGLAGCDDYTEETLERLPTDPGEQGLLEHTATIGARFDDGYRLHVENTEPKAGLLTFEVTNPTEVAHGFLIVAGPDEAVTSREVPAGEMRTIEVELEPGPKVIYCPMGDHAERGERVEIVVEE